MSTVLKFKPKEQQLRLIFSDAPQSAMPRHAGKVFAVIGPFDNFSDWSGFHEALQMLVRGYNLE